MDEEVKKTTTEILNGPVICTTETAEGEVVIPTVDLSKGVKSSADNCSPIEVKSKG